MQTLTREKLVEAYRQKTRASAAHFERARNVLPAGVTRNTGFRSPHPIYMDRGEGKYLFDIDGNRYLDFTMNYGPNLLGHCPAVVNRRVHAELDRGFGLGAPTLLEVEVGERALDMIPGAERIRFLNSGTEATMHMIRAARSITGRERIVKFEGAYHGSHDAVMLSVWPPSAGTLPHYYSKPQTEGIPQWETSEVLAVPYNDLAVLESCLQEYKDQVAAIIMDPGMNGCGLAQPAEGFLNAVAELARANGALLIFDEVVTGFRYAPGGAQEHFGIRADLCAYGKCLGGGAPIGAIAGRAEMMEVFNLDAGGHARVPHSGTFNGNIPALAASAAFLEYVAENLDLYGRINSLGDLARARLGAIGERLHAPLLVTGNLSMFQVHFGIQQIRNYHDFVQRDLRFRQHLFWYMAVNGTIVPQSGTFFVSTVHSEQDIQALADCLEQFLVEHYLPLVSESKN